MTKTSPLSLSLAIILILTGGVSAKPGGGPRMAQEIPKTATVEIILVGAPGINEVGSRWEIAYDFRIATDALVWEAGKQGKFKGGSTDRVGDLIKQGSVKKAVRSPENRRILFRIPLSPEIQERLRNHPRDRIRFTPGQITPEVIKLAREQEMKSQSFLFYSVLEIYDAKLKKTLLIPASRTWPFSSYPSARFEIKVEINNDGSYSVNSSLPTKSASN